MKNFLVKDLLWELNFTGFTISQRNFKYLEWLNSDLLHTAEEFVGKNRLQESYFVIGMNNAFRTTRFELLLKRWLVEYFLKLFGRLNDLNDLSLEDNILNRFGVEKYRSRFEKLPKIKWEKPPNFFQRLFSIALRCPIILYHSLNTGLKIYGKKKKYKIMREALWGLYDIGGHYFHDDFLVDGDKVKKEDILLFSRGIPKEGARLKAYNDVKKSCYWHFDLSSLSLGVRPLFSRIIPKYIILGSRTLFKEIFSRHFSMYWSIYLYFIYNALPYEKLFSHFEVISELAHNCFSPGHIPEAIVCQNYGTRYYFMNWSDLSIGIDGYIVSFLGCDGYLLWGKAHFTGMEGDSRILMPTGYVFKKFIKKVASNRDKILSDMSIENRGKIISFFEENFGKECAMTEENFMVFWRTILKVARKEETNTIVIKPKTQLYHKPLSAGSKKEFYEILETLSKMKNVYVLDLNKWSFIEVIGISDIVVTQGMTSSATIALICGIEGLYLDQAQYNHPFSRLFKNQIVFDDPDRFLEMLFKIVHGEEKPSGHIPEPLMREYDAFDDDSGVDRFRSVLVK